MRFPAFAGLLLTWQFLATQAFVAVEPAVFRISTASVVEVQDEDGQFLPLCADSLTQPLALAICNQQHFQYVNSIKVVPLSNILSLNVFCLSARNCSQYLAFGCENTVELTCANKPPASKCPKGMFVLDSHKCIRIDRKTFSSYEEAKNHCTRQKLQLVSLSSANVTISQQINKIIKALHTKRFMPGPNTKLLTSAVRMSSQWQWSDGVIYDGTVEGQGRCLGLVANQLVAVDCSGNELIPVCEKNLALNCIQPDGVYDGNLTTTKNGLTCLQWNNPGIGQSTSLFPSQRLWNHNYCRNPGGVRDLPWCLVGANLFQECDVLLCPLEGKVSDDSNFSGCADDEVRCGLTDQCVLNEYVCDYERDCQNGFDELNCPDFLKEFESIGPLKIVDSVNEIWTHIPNAQGCARRCIQSSQFRCGSFSYDEPQRVCILSTESASSAIVYDNKDSQFWSRTFTKLTIEYVIDPATKTVMVQKNQISTAVCVDALNDTAVEILCDQFGYGQSLTAFSILPVFDKVALTWTVDCLRDVACDYPTLPLGFNDSDCRAVLRCSECRPNEQFACRSSGECIPATSVCNAQIDCSDGSDEDGCFSPKWRLAGLNSTSSGRMQVFLHGLWSDVCMDGLTPQATEALCLALGQGPRAQILPINSRYPTATTLRVDCRTGVCMPRGMQECREGVLNLRCLSPTEPECGRQFVNVTAPDASSKRRFARVVGGYGPTAGAFPWTAALKFKFGLVHHCGAAIISPMHLLTAAHCFQDDKAETDFVIVAGDYDSSRIEGTEQMFSVAKIHFYPLFEDIFQHDIAIVEIFGQFSFNQYVQPICLPPIGFKYEAGMKCTVTGWGSNGTLGVESVPQMQAASMPIIEREECLKLSTVYAALSSTAFCAGYLSGGVDSCQGDSGGPFACQFQDHFYLAGVISWGDGCAQREQPGIYTMIPPYIPWIENITQFNF